jgi:hypothetical protein
LVAQNAALRNENANLKTQLKGNPTPRPVTPPPRLTVVDPKFQLTVDMTVT